MTGLSHSKVVELSSLTKDPLKADDSVLLSDNHGHHTVMHSVYQTSFKFFSPKRSVQEATRSTSHSINEKRKKVKHTHTHSTDISDIHVPLL